MMRPVLVIVAQVLFFLSAARMPATGVPEAIDYPVDYEASLSAMGEEMMVLAYRDPIILSRDSRLVESIGPGGYLYIRRRYPVRSVELIARPVVVGGVEIKLRINGIERRYPENYQAVVGDVLEEASRQHGLGAYARMSRAYESAGIDGAVGVLQKVQSISARRHLFGELAKRESLTSHELVALIRWANALPANSELRRLIVNLSTLQADSIEVSAELYKSVARLASSSDRTDTLIEIAANRGMAGFSADAAFRAIRGIPSSADKARALLSVAGYLSDDPDNYIRFLDTAVTIPSSSDKSRVLVAYIEVFALSALLPDNFELLLRTVGTVPGAADRERVIMALLGLEGLSDESLADLLNFTHTRLGSRAGSERIVSAVADYRASRL